MTTRRHTIILVVEAKEPASDLTDRQVGALVKRLISIGKEDAQATVRNGEGDLDEAKQALALRVVSVETAAL